jgi:ribonuclease I
MALSMAILTQINVSVAQHEHARKEYRTAADYHKTQQDILEQIRLSEQAKSISEQAVIREEMNALVADVKYDIAYADLENAYANAYAAVGTDPLSIDANISDLEELTDSIKQHFESISQNNLDFSMRYDSVSKLNKAGLVFY